MDSGALSRIDAQVVRSALSLASNGRVFDLGVEIGEHIPHNPDFARFSMAFSHTPEGTAKLSPFQYSVEIVSGVLHTSTHIDAFVHVQQDGRIYGGSSAADSRSDRGWEKHGAETIPPIVGRAIILDIPRLKGMARLPDLYEITIDDVTSELDRSNQRIEIGDIVLVRTGKILDFGDEAKFQAAEPGVGVDAALWLYEQGMSVLGTDTTGTEPLPFRDPTRTTHHAMLVQSGVHLIENLFLEDLAAEGIGAGLFVGLPLKFKGATGSWLRPVVIV